MPKGLAVPVMIWALLTLAVGQETPASRPAPEVNLALEDQAKPFQEKDPIVVTVFRLRDSAAEAAPLSDLSFWRIGLGTETYTVTKTNIDARFVAELQRLTAPSVQKTPPFMSRQGLLIRADMKAPYILVERVLAQLPSAKLYRIFFESLAGADSQPMAVALRLPLETDPADPEGLPDIRLVAVLTADGRVARTFDINPRRIPVGSDGDNQLEALLRTKYEDYKKGWTAPIAVVIEGHPGVPWQHVLDLVNLGRRVGVKRIEFAEYSPPPPPSPPETAEAQPEPRPRRGIELPRVDEPDSGPSVEDQASRPAPAVSLAAADQAKPFSAKDPIVITVFRTAPAAGAETRPRSETDWAIGVGPRRFTSDRAGMTRLAGHLNSKARNRLRKRAPFVSEQPLLISGDAQAPYGMVQKALEAAVAARIYKIWIEVGPGSDRTRLALASWLPIDSGPVESTPEYSAEIRVILSWNEERRRLERLFGQTVVPTTPEGDRRLEELLRLSHEDFRNKAEDAPVIIDAGPLTPWQNVVDVMNMAHRIGINKVEFGMGTEMK